jgi:hypothetical protein
MSTNWTYRQGRIILLYTSCKDLWYLMGISTGGCIMQILWNRQLRSVSMQAMMSGWEWNDNMWMTYSDDLSWMCRRSSPLISVLQVWHIQKRVLDVIICGWYGWKTYKLPSQPPHTQIWVQTGEWYLLPLVISHATMQWSNTPGWTSELHYLHKEPVWWIEWWCGDASSFRWQFE